MIVYSLLLALALVVSSPWWGWRMATGGRYRAGLAGRMGLVPHSLDEVIAQRGAATGLIWLHAVSVGEVLAAQRLIAELQTALPGCLLAVSTTTETGQQIAREKLGGVPVFYYPLDFAFAVRRYLRALRPTLFITVESEFWPRMLVECERAGVPVAVVNARISDRSFPRSLRLRRLWQPMLAKVSLFLAQGEETTERLRRLGVAATQIQVSGNLKFDLPAIDQNAMAERLDQMRGARRMLVAGSTLEGEERILLGAWAGVLKGAADAILVLAPRHPQRFAEVAQLLAESGYPWRRCTELEPGEELAPGVILLLDTLGDLAAVYSSGTAAFLGGSLVARGGHNPLEPARFGKPIVMGESFENFREIVTAMKAEGAIRVTTVDALGDALLEALGDARLSGERARLFFEAQAGATERTALALIGLERIACRGMAGQPQIPFGNDKQKGGMPRPWLLPLHPLYRAGLGVKNHLYATRRLRIRALANPAISVGSLSAGGAGKTPAVLALADLLQRSGFAVDVLSRGYGRSSRAVAQVDAGGSPQEFGDEPLELARAGLSVFVAAERYEAGLLAEQTRPGTVHLLDDGFQHRRLARACDVVLVTLADLHDHLLPAGNLREPLSSLRRADAVILREDEAEAIYPITSCLTRARHWTIRRTLSLPPDAPARAFAFAGIARPLEFFEGVPRVGQLAFADHHPYSLEDCDALVAAARRAGADGFLTTAKDAVKLTPAHLARLAAVGPVAVATLRCTFLQEEVVLGRIREVLSTLSS